MGIEFFRARDVVARKQHFCEACGRKIHIGLKCHHEVGKYDGDFFSRYWCEDCTAVMYWWFAQTAETEFDYWDISDELQDVICENCPHGWCGDGADDCKEESVWHCPRILEVCKGGIK